MDLRPLTDAVLLARLQALVGQERGSIADVIEHLAEVDRREIVVDAGYATLFDYCVNNLRYSEAAAFLRIRAARAATSFPRVLTDLRSGALHLDAVMQLSPYLNKENSDRLLDMASGVTKQKILSIVASLGGSTEAPERDVIRRLPSKPVQPPPKVELGSVPVNAMQADIALLAVEQEPASVEAATFPAPISTTTTTPAPAGAAAIIPPPSKVRLSFTADDAFLLKFERLRALRRHKFPAGRLEDLLDEAIDALLNRIDPDRKKLRPRAADAANIENARMGVKRKATAAVKALVWKRDGGRCTYTSADGRRCESRDFLEYDHIQPWSLGGRSDSSNIRLLCRPHNQRLARKRFGPRRRRDRTLVRPDAVRSGT